MRGAGAPDWSLVNPVRTVHANVTVPVPAARALRAFLDEGDLQAWWGVERLLVDPRPGGAYALTWGVSSAGFRYVTTGVIQRYQPESLLEIGNYTYFAADRAILGPMQLRVVATAHPLGTCIDLTQDGYGYSGDWDWYYDSVLAAWPVALAMYAQHLTRSTPKA